MSGCLRKLLNIAKSQQPAVQKASMLKPARNIHRHVAWSSPFLMNRVTLWLYFYKSLNKLDAKRLTLVGPDRASAEWLLKCGARVRWKGWINPVVDYRHLQSGNFDLFKIEEIECTNSLIMYEGFIHLKGCKHVNRVSFHKCRFFDDGCIHGLGLIRNSLKHIQITSCKPVTDRGIRYLTLNENLESLVLCDLQNVKNKLECLDYLQTHMPQCRIEWPEVIDPSRLPKDPENSGS